MQIAIGLFPGFTALDAIGPYQVFTNMPGIDVVTDMRRHRWPGPRRAAETRRRRTLTDHKTPKIVTAKEWQQTRDELLAAEKEAARALDVPAARHPLPMVKFDNANAFDTPDGTNKRGSIADSPPRSTTTIPRRVNVPVGTSPCSSTRWPDAAASLREGLEDVITVRRLGVGGRLAASLTNTSCIESMISIACDTTKNVKRWRDGKMIKRRCAATMLNAECSFRRLKGYRWMPRIVTALIRHLEAVTPACETAQVAGMGLRTLRPMTAAPRWHRFGSGRS